VRGSQAVARNMLREMVLRNAAANGVRGVTSSQACQAGVANTVAAAVVDNSSANAQNAEKARQNAQSAQTQCAQQAVRRMRGELQCAYRQRAYAQANRAVNQTAANRANGSVL